MPAMATALPLDRYAAVHAELSAGRLRDDVLARAGLSLEDWAAAQRTWLEEMGRELSLGRFDLTNQYTRAFLERQRALSTPVAVVPAGPPAMPIRAPEVSTPSAEAVPSYLAPGAAPVPSVASALPPAPLANPILAGTMMAIDGAALRAALPFDAQARPAPPAPPPPPVKRAPAALSGTAIGHVVPKAAALPFAPGASSSVPSPALPPPGALPAVRRAPAALSGTSMAIIAPKGPALPFGAGASGAPPAAGAPPGPPPTLTLEQYAALCAELAAFPQQQDAVFQRYGLGAQRDRAAVDAAWKHRLGADPDEYQRWLALYQQHQRVVQGAARREP
jgi:hypothetical protein